MSFPISLIRLARPHQHVKNFFVFLPLFFAGGLMDVEKFMATLAAFAGFSLSASGIYVLNDLLDVGEDRVHPKKRRRPIAAGEVSSIQAKFLSAVLIPAGLAVMTFLPLPAPGILSLYILNNIGYTFWLKRVPLLDVTLVAVGFVLRLFAGSFAAGIPLSEWIVVLTFLLALFLAIAKRRDDLVIHLRTGDHVRIASKGYNLEMINSAVTLLAAAVILVYLQYTLSDEVTRRLGSEHLYLTTLFVVLGVLRYLQVTFVLEDSGSPTRVFFSDRFTQVNLFCWFFSFGWILYSA